MIPDKPLQLFLCVVFLHPDLNFLGYKAWANSISLEIAKLVSHLALPNNIQLFYLYHDSYHGVIYTINQRSVLFHFNFYMTLHELTFKYTLQINAYSLSNIGQRYV